MPPSPSGCWPSCCAGCIYLIRRRFLRSPPASRHYGGCLTHGYFGPPPRAPGGWPPFNPVDSDLEMMFFEQTAPVFALELYTVSASIFALRRVIKSSSIVIYIDNNAALSAIVEGPLPAPSLPAWCLDYGAR